jgi:hypothetical protein
VLLHVAKRASVDSPLRPSRADQRAAVVPKRLSFVILGSVMILGSVGNRPTIAFVS